MGAIATKIREKIFRNGDAIIMLITLTLRKYHLFRGHLNLVGMKRDFLILLSHFLFEKQNKNKANIMKKAKL